MFLFLEIMSEDIDYFNLLADTLRSSYLQVEKIYNTIDKIRNFPGQFSFVNIRTGYRMKYHFKDSRYFYNNNDNYPLCYNFESYAGASMFTIRRLIHTYEKWLEEYERHKDISIIKKLVEEELKEARLKSEKNLQENSNKSPLELLGELAKNRCPRAMQKIFRDEWNEDALEDNDYADKRLNDSLTSNHSDYEDDSFIVKTEDENEKESQSHYSTDEIEAEYSYPDDYPSKKKKAFSRGKNCSKQSSCSEDKNETPKVNLLKSKRLRKPADALVIKENIKEDEFDFEIAIHNYEETTEKKYSNIISD